MSIAIDIQGLRKTYPRTWKSKPFEALRGISLSVEQGEVFGFIGPNGAGKSTTIKILTGAMGATQGNAYMFGIDVTQASSRQGMGYVPENPSLPDYLTPFEILVMAVQLHNIKVDNVRKHCLAWLERFELSTVANKVVRSFSKGMAQRTALAHALAVNPRLLILDEPLSGLDPVGRKDVVDILAEYKKQGGTIFLTSHVLHDVERLADRFGLIHQGELKTVQSPIELAGENDTVLLRSLGQDHISGMQAESHQCWYVETPRSALWEWLHRLETQGHTVVEIRPALTLEKKFMSLVGKS